ncbi:alpha/beta fold hydrolase [Leptolyngbya sp. PCC 6406]|uniref:alpha/beta fold hydrolase n=1 Tax=Leptolyngbya sp. PCC 6406 TaxID=1173264 RepID=UPI0002AC95A1|nr:alpha/beta hydrolase [Leptolyngbya sp. PCC 6406]
MPYLQIQTTPHFYDLTPAIPGAATLVFIHGWVLSHRYWTPITNTLASHYRCLTYDLRGFGASNHIPPSVDSGNGVTPDYGLSAYARDLETLLQKLNLGPVWLVGHSLGGSIALWAAHLWPDRVQGVICVNAGGGIYLPEEFQRFRRAGTQIVRWRSSWLSRIPLLDLGFARMMVAQPLSRQWGRQRLLDLLAAHPEAALGALLASTTEAEVHRLPQVVASLRQPTYFVAGGADPVMEERYVRHLASFHTLFHQEAGNVSVLPHCGHMAMLEQPSALAQQIRQYVEAVARMDTAAKPIDSHRATTAILQKPMNGV